MPSTPVEVSDLAAESTPGQVVGRGARVRETTPGSPVAESVGIVREFTHDSVHLETNEGRDLPFALSPTVRLEVSRGMKSNVGRGAWMGALIGGAGLGLAGAVSCNGDGGIFDPTSSDCAVGGALIGGVSGTLLGIVLGAFARTERWEEVPLVETTPLPAEDVASP